MESRTFFLCVWALCHVRWSAEHSKWNEHGKMVRKHTSFFYYDYFVSIRKRACVYSCVCHCAIYGKNAKSKSQTKVFDEIKPFSQTIAGGRLLSAVHDTMRTNRAEGHNISEISLLMMMINAMIDKDSLVFTRRRYSMEDCGKIITATGSSSRIFACVLSSCTAEHKNAEAGALAGSCTIFVSNWTRTMSTWTLLAHKFLSLVVTNSEISIKKNEPVLLTRCRFTHRQWRNSIQCDVASFFFCNVARTIFHLIHIDKKKHFFHFYYESQWVNEQRVYFLYSFCAHWFDKWLRTENGFRWVIDMVTSPWKTHLSQ